MEEGAISPTVAEDVLWASLFGERDMENKK